MYSTPYRLLSAALALGAVLAGLVSCSRAPGGVVKADVVKSDKARLAPSVDQSLVGELVDGNTQFALDLYRAVGDSGANIFLSPYSISLALAMTYAGARGRTAEEMAQTLHFALPQEALHQAFNALDQTLAKRGGQAKDEGEPFRLHVANALWGQQGYAFQPAFLDLLAQSYGAGLRLVDFQGAPESARQTINRWVEEQTEQKIKDLLPPGSVNTITRLVLSNAIYFNAGWQYPFEEQATQDAPFHLLDGGTVTVPLMQENEHLGYAEGEGYQAVEVPYVGGEMSMVVLLPAQGQFQPFAQSLSAVQLAAILQSLKPQPVALALPRFKYDSSLRLKDALVQLGMVQAFDAGAADFSGLTGHRDLFIDNVYHKAFVAVDEKGTEAAAATAVVARLTAVAAQPKVVRVDRPFIFLIRDVQTGAVLFLGQVVNPGR